MNNTIKDAMLWETLAKDFKWKHLYISKQERADAIENPIATWGKMPTGCIVLGLRLSWWCPTLITSHEFDNIEMTMTIKQMMGGKDD